MPCPIIRRVFFLLSLFLVQKLSAQITLASGNLQLTLDKKGVITSVNYMVGSQSTSLLHQDTSSALLSIIHQGKQFLPDQLLWDRGKKILTFHFKKAGAKVLVSATPQNTHLTLKVTEAKPESAIDAIVWGPVHTNLHHKIGEVVGVVRSKSHAFGFLLLQKETMGGHYSPDGESGGRGALALPWQEDGSSVQAYAPNRAMPKTIHTMALKGIPVPPMKAAYLKGSAIALFTCPEEKALDVIEQVVQAENLPYPKVKGVWTKKAFLKSRSYLISEFKEQEIDKIIDIAQRGGFFSLYHSGPFKTWGHYPIDSAFFPSGNEGVKKCAKKAHDAGLFFGVHTLTNFINPEDPYVWGKPDPRLMASGQATLNANISAEDTTIPVSHVDAFNQNQNNHLRTVRIGDELIQYDGITTQVPFMLQGCKRGMFGTKAAAHSTKETVYKLIDHAYKVFFPNFDLQQEIARNLGQYFNEMGIDHLDFDGHEGCYASGQGDMAPAAFAEALLKEVKHDIINGTSMSKPYYWYMNTLCNWGEPWYGGFKESMQEYRISNQAMLERNYFPNMLGWYILGKNTTYPEMEWMLARAAGWNAGFAMVTSVSAVRANPIGLGLLDIIKQWEKARMGDAFNEAQRELLKNGSLEFHLETINDKAWNLYALVNIPTIRHEVVRKQPGEPTATSHAFELNSFEQGLRWRLQVNGETGQLQNLKLVLDDQHTLLIKDPIAVGETLVYQDSPQLILYDEKGKFKKYITLDYGWPKLKKGNHVISIDGKSDNDSPIQLEWQIQYLDHPQQVKAKQ